MKEASVLAIGLLLVLSAWANAQSVPPPPAPIAESDLRDNTIRMRSMELERIKREADRVTLGEYPAEQETRFARTKESFENIQKLQDSIVKAYTTGKEIDYSEISRAASNIRKNSLSLDEHLFGVKPEETGRNENTDVFERKNVRDLIIELDNAIGNFVKSPIFQNTRVVDTKTSKETQLVLKNIMGLSYMLSLEAEKMK